jgi:hypothetical protein
LEFRDFQPPQERLRADTGGAGSFLDIPLRQQSGDRLSLPIATVSAVNRRPSPVLRPGRFSSELACNSGALE